MAPTPRCPRRCRRCWRRPGTRLRVPGGRSSSSGTACGPSSAVAGDRHPGAQPPGQRGHRRLPGAHRPHRPAGRPARAARRRGRRARRRRPAGLRDAAAPDARPLARPRSCGERVPVSYSCSTSCTSTAPSLLARALRPGGARCWSELDRRAAGARAAVGHRGERRAAARGGPRARSGRGGRQAPHVPLRAGPPVPGLGQDGAAAHPGGGGRRLDGGRGAPAQTIGALLLGAYDGTARCATSGTSAPGSPRPCCARCWRGWGRASSDEPVRRGGAARGGAQGPLGAPGAGRRGRLPVLTKEDRLRHAAWRGLRSDKDPADAVI